MGSLRRNTETTEQDVTSSKRVRVGVFRMLLFPSRMAKGFHPTARVAGVSLTWPLGQCRLEGDHVGQVHVAVPIEVCILAFPGYGLTRSNETFYHRDEIRQINVTVAIEIAGNSRVLDDVDRERVA